MHFSKIATIFRKLSIVLAFLILTYNIWILFACYNIDNGNTEPLQGLMDRLKRTVLNKDINLLQETGQLTEPSANDLTLTEELLTNLTRQIDQLKRQLSAFKEKEDTLPTFISPRHTSQPSTIPTIYIITATHSRPCQKADLTRLSHTLRLVPQILWIVVEDSPDPTPLVTHLLARTGGLAYVHLAVKTPVIVAPLPKNRARGVVQRNAALRWIRDNVRQPASGPVYIADDDNTYDLQIFEEMRYTRGVAVWPVGLISDMKYERPLVTNGTVTGFYAWNPKRPFALDMAAFAVHTSLILTKPNIQFNEKSRPGMLETNFLEQFRIQRRDLEVKAENCTKVFVWHTKCLAPKISRESTFRDRYDPNIEV